MRTFGWLRDKPDHRDYKYALQHEFMLPQLTLPKSVDLRSQMSKIEDQGQLGSCVAHATCGALEYLELQTIKSNVIAPINFGSDFQDLSRLFIYYNARALDGTTKHDYGTTVRSAIKAIRSVGVCREALWPYYPQSVFTSPTSTAFSEAKNHKVLYGYRINNQNLVEMKQCLANGFPFIFGFSVYDSFMSHDTARTGIVSLPSKSEDTIGGHAVCCVGYDDTTHSFLIRNSWGADWGIQGYCWMPYLYLTNPDLAADFWTLRKTGPNS
jgi:C1A family cysteine protease